MPPALPQPSPPGVAGGGGRRDYGWFGAGVAAWFGSFGMQGVLFAWLLVGELGEPAERVGFAQTATMLPSLLLLLVGGATADRSDTRRLLIALHAVALVPPLALAWVVWSGQLSFAGLFAYGLAMGTISAFIMPARDTLLSRVAGADMMRAVTGITAVQFGSQALGAVSAGLARFLGSPLTLALQGLVVGSGALTTTRVPPAPPHPREGPHTTALREIADGLREVARTPNLRAPVTLVLGVGLFFIGPFLVCFPLLVRDYYQGGVGELSIVNMLFPIGTITGSLVLRARGGVERKGRAALLALATGASFLGAIGSGLPFPVFIAAILGWGLAGSIFINCCRTLVQEAAPSAHRARVLSIFQLGFIGAGPVGASLAGLLAGELGTLVTLRLFSAAMLTFVTAMWLLTNTSRLR